MEVDLVDAECGNNHIGLQRGGEPDPAALDSFLTGLRLAYCFQRSSSFRLENSQGLTHANVIAKLELFLRAQLALPILGGQPIHARLVCCAETQAQKRACPVDG
jgi:hypothetical protein